MRLLSLLLAVVLALSAAVPAEAWSAASFDAQAEAVLGDLISAEHDRVCGDGPLGSGLVEAEANVRLARWRAEDLGVRDYFSHTILGTDRQFAAYFPGYGIEEWRTAGEILAWNTYADSRAPATAFAGFMASPEHRPLIENCAYDAFGVGSWKTPAGKKLFAVIFTEQRLLRVSTPVAELRAAPGADGRVVAALAAGTVLVDWQARTGWYQVRTPGGQSGWVDGAEVR